MTDDKEAPNVAKTIRNGDSEDPKKPDQVESLSSKLESSSLAPGSDPHPATSASALPADQEEKEANEGFFRA